MMDMCDNSYCQLFGCFKTTSQLKQDFELWSYVDSLVNRNSISLPDVSRLRDGSMSSVGWSDGQVG